MLLFLVGQRVLFGHGPGWEFEVKSGELLAERFGLEKGNLARKAFSKASVNSRAFTFSLALIFKS